MNTSALKTLRDMIALYSDSIAYLEGKLSVQIIVDAGMILVMKEANGNERFYGHFRASLTAPKDSPNVKGWLSRCAIPNHLCGTSMFTRENATRNLAQLRASADVGVTYDIRHYRDELERRLTNSREMLAVFEGKLAEFEGTCVTV